MNWSVKVLERTHVRYQDRRGELKTSPRLADETKVQNVTESTETIKAEPCRAL